MSAFYPGHLIVILIIVLLMGAVDGQRGVRGHVDHQVGPGHRRRGAAKQGRGRLGQARLRPTWAEHGLPRNQPRGRCEVVRTRAMALVPRLAIDVCHRLLHSRQSHRPLSEPGKCERPLREVYRWSRWERGRSARDYLDLRAGARLARQQGGSSRRRIVPPVDHDENLSRVHDAFQMRGLIHGNAEADERTRNRAALLFPAAATADIVQIALDASEEVAAHQHASETRYQEGFDLTDQVQNVVKRVMLDKPLEIFGCSSLLVQLIRLHGRTSQDADGMPVDSSGVKSPDGVARLLVEPKVTYCGLSGRVHVLCRRLCARLAVIVKGAGGPVRFLQYRRAHRVRLASAMPMITITKIRILSG
jgi:hypothetical protein